MKKSNKPLIAFVNRKMYAALAALTCGALAGTTPAAMAQTDGFKPLAVISAGIACEYPLRIEARGEGNFYKEFRDQSGNLVRIISAGSKVDYRFTNTLSNAQYVINGRGAMTKDEIAADGSRTTSLHGHTVVILFPTDNPPGPSTTEYVGRVVYTTDANGVSVLKQTSGQKSDLCAKLDSAG